MPFLGILTGLRQPMPLDQSGTADRIKEEDASRTTLDESFDEMEGLGDRDSRCDGVKSQRSKPRLRQFIRRHWFEAITVMVVLFVVIVVLGSLLGTNRSRSKNERKDINVDSSWFSSPSVSDGQAPLSSPTLFPEYVPPPPTLGDPDYPSIREQLSKVFDMSLLEDSASPLGRAYNWIENEDDARTVSKNPSVVQRFVLAAFYFSTGGGRTRTTWSVCSAVPTELVTERNSFSTRCVIDDADQGDVICAKFESFVECPEYYEQYDLVNTPENPKKRWLSGVSECNWYGVTCNQNGQVEELSLPGNGLQGELLPELDRLLHLHALNIGANALTGSLPEWKGWPQMHHMIIYQTELEGSLPEGWKTWKELKTLDLADNALTGALILPGNWMEIEAVIVHSNNFDISLRPRIGETSHLQTLDLNRNNVVGSIPDSIDNLRDLSLLDLSHAHLTGSLPSTMGVLTNLVELRLEENALTGDLPTGLWNLSILQVLRLGHNEFSGTLSTSVGNLQALKHLSLEQSGLSDELPDSLGGLFQLEEVQLQFNDFTGDVPEGLCEIPSLVVLRANCGGRDKMTCLCCTECCSERRECQATR